MRQPLTIFLAFLAASLPTAGAADIDPCDAAAGHPSDPGLVGPGVPTGEVATHVAIPACRAAVERDPDNPRFHYQLGRVIYYWAGANDGDAAEAVIHIQQAADMGYAQAQFVRGLLHKYAGDHCASEPLVRAAADQGLKSAYLTYADDALAGRYGDCAEFATRDRLEGYLGQVSVQLSGYYQTMLLGALERQLEGYRVR